MSLKGSKIGYNNSLLTSGFSIISNAVVTDPTGEQARVISTSIEDSLSGTGIQKVKISYVDTDQSFNNEIIETNGLSPVLTTATNILRIESFEAFQVGSLGGAAGTISLQSTSGLDLFSQIDTGENQFLRAVHFVSPGKVGEIADIIVSTPTSGGVYFTVFKEVDNTESGGGIVTISDISFTLVSDIIHIQLSYPVRCDASNSTNALRMGISVLGLVIGQTALASFKFNEY
jgi:hypothetical protein